MELHKAIQRAVKFVARGKDTSNVLRRVRFFAATDAAPSYVHATNGELGAIIPVDVSCPDMCLEADAIVGPAKDPIESVYVDNSGALSTIFRGKIGGAYAVGHESPLGFPEFPQYPERMTPVPNFQRVLMALHATLPPGNTVGGKPRLDLECLHFLPDRVEATDAARMVLIDASTGCTGKVPALAFKNWPKKEEVAVAFTDTHAWFQIGEEMRYQLIQKGTYSENRDLRAQHVPQYHDGPWMTVPTKRFKEVVKKAMAVSPTKLVILSFGVHGVEVKAQDVEPNPEDTYEHCAFEEKVEGRVGVAGGSILEYPVMYANGKFLDESLRVITTPNVRLCYGGAAKPLRLESGGYVECIWPVGIGG